MASSTIQRSFAAGEIAVDLYARADQVKYQTGLRTCRNFVVMRHGGVTNRTGSQMISEVKDSSDQTYFIKFVFNAAQTYVIEVGDRYLRFYRNAAQIGVSGVAAWSALTSYVVADLVVVGGVNYYCILAHLNHTPPNATYWYPLTGAIYEIPTPYVAADISALRFVQSGDVVTIVHRSYAPRELRRTGHTSWTLVTFTTAPSISAPANLAATAGTAGALVFDYLVTAAKEGTYEESIGSTPDSCSCVAPTSSAPNTLAWDAVADAAEYYVYLDKYGNGVYGYVGTASTNAFRDIGYTPDMSKTPPIDASLFASTDDYPGAVSYSQQRRFFASSNNEPEKSWASKSGAFTNYTTSSPIQDDDSISYTIAGDQVNEIRHLVELVSLVVLTSGGEWQLLGEPSSGLLTPTQINPKQHGYNGAADVRPIKIGNTILYVQARGSILRDLRFNLQADGYESRDLTIFSAHLVDGYSIDRMDYAQIPHSVAWMIRSDGSLIGLTYMREQEVFGWHRHDTEGTYEDVCVVPEGEEDAVYVIVNRTINGATKRYIERFASRRFTDIRYDAYFLDSFLSYDGRNDDDALTVTISGSAWTYEDLVTITASSSAFGASDVGKVVALLDSDGNELCRIEISAYNSVTEVEGYPDRTVPEELQSVATADWSLAVDTVAGLDHLEGETVAALCDGNVVDDLTVSGGEVELGRQFNVVHVGLPYVCDLETLDLDLVEQNIRDTKKRIQGVQVQVKETRGGQIGSDEDNLVEFKIDVPTEMDGLPPLVTGRMEVAIGSTWEETGRFLFRQTDPLPVTILATIPTGEIGG